MSDNPAAVHRTVDRPWTQQPTMGDLVDAARPLGPIEEQGQHATRRPLPLDQYSPTPLKVLQVPYTKLQTAQDTYIPLTRTARWISIRNYTGATLYFAPNEALAWFSIEDREAISWDAEAAGLTFYTTVASVTVNGPRGSVSPSAPNIIAAWGW